MLKTFLSLCRPLELLLEENRMLISESPEMRNFPVDGVN